MSTVTYCDRCGNDVSKRVVPTHEIGGVAGKYRVERLASNPSGIGTPPYQHVPPTDLCAACAVELKQFFEQLHKAAS
jgi:hypothetical protein